MTDYQSEAIAVIGMSGRFPGARNVAEFWNNLANGVESISFFSDEDLRSAGVDPTWLQHPDYVKAGGVLADIDMFDAPFFGFSARDAEILDPQHRIFLECAWQSLEHAGYNPETYRGLIGVYAGAAMSTYLLNLYGNPTILGSTDTLQLLLGNDKDHLTTQVSYKLNLRGASVAVQTACSTSLVAVGMACYSLLNYECDIALAGGVAVNPSQGKGYVYQRGGISSPDGHCRTFDADALGTVSGYGAGIVVLKRLSEAVAEGDVIYAVIRGWAINNDGSLKAGYTAPSVEGQAQVIAMAQAMAGVKPDAISYVEAHGTATPLGDPIEVAALTQVFRADTSRTGFCGLGSVKSNIGHLDTAAGIAGLMKTVLALKHQQLPASLHFRQPNPAIDFARSPFFVVDRLTPWQSAGTRRVAGVSSFGMGGTNVHLVVEEGPAREPSGPNRPVQLLLLSARTRTALETLTDEMSRHLRDRPDVSLADIAYTTQVGRKAFAHRRLVVCGDSAPVSPAEAVQARDPRLVKTASIEPGTRSVAFLFPGQGAQHPGMARGVYECEPYFQEVFDRAAEGLVPHLGLDLREVVLAEGGDTPANADRLNHTALAQPSLFAVEYALASLWMRWGVRPDAMIGHSVGEYVAACLAGVFSLEDALYLVAVRGQLMGQAPRGAMLAVPLTEAEVADFLNDGLSLAAVNGPRLCVLSGAIDAIERAARALESRGLQGRRLRTSHAFHSAMMDPVLATYRAHVSGVRLAPPRIPCMSNVTGRWLTAADATDPDYWVMHLRQPVRFADGLEPLVRESDWVLLEVGPGQTLSGLARQQARRSMNQVVVASLPHPDGGDSEAALLEGLGRLWLAGVSIDWAAFSAFERRHRVELPTYPFERQRYWVDGQQAATDAAVAALVQRQQVSDWFYAASWQRAVAPVTTHAANASTEPRNWLVFADSAGVGHEVVKALRERGETATVVARKDGAGQVAADFRIDPSNRAEYDVLLDAASAAGVAVTHVVHLWNVTSTVETERIATPEALDASFYSVLFLGQALASRPRKAPVQIAVVSNNLHDVFGDDPIQPIKAPLLGACKVIPQEHPSILCRSVDIVLSPHKVEKPSVAEQLIAELTTEPFEPVVAYRRRTRWVQVFVPVRLDASEQEVPAVRHDGVYLITGGLGQIGLLVAETFARSGPVRLILTARSALPPESEWNEWLARTEEHPTARTIRRITALRQGGADVMVTAADAGDFEQMRQVISEARERFGAINGIVHAAGYTAEGSSQPMLIADRATCERHFGPKLHGLLHLRELVTSSELDFCVLFSSLSSVLGGLGFCAYAAANAFMDAFATREGRISPTRWISVNWDGWYFLRPGEHNGDSAAAHHLIRPSEGMDALQRILQHRPQGPIVVSPIHLQPRLDQWVRLQAVREAPTTAAAEEAPPHERPALTTSYVAPRNAVEQTLCGQWQQLLGLSQVGVHDNFFELGGHSLLAVQLVSRIYQTYHVEVPVNRVFEAPTIAELSLMLEPDVHAAEESRVAELLDFVEQLSDSEVKELLSEGSVDDPKAIQKRVYSEINRNLDAGEFGQFTYFLNFGYVAGDNPQHATVALPPRCLNRQSVKLVLELVGDCELRGRRVLDVGCGRGGTLSTIVQFFEPARAVGVDLCAAAVAFCCATHAQSGARFLEGDAEQLPFLDRSFDVVTNVESSHAYPRIHDFYSEVFRVLRPGGCLLHTDLRLVSDWRLDAERIQEIGFHVEHDRDITSNVLHACEEVAAARRGAFTNYTAPLPLDEFLAVPGSEVHAQMQSGFSQYRIRRLRKPS